MVQVSYKGTHVKCKIVRPKHVNHKGCPECFSKSLGITSIIKTLQKKKIDYVVEKQFDDCINPVTKKRLRFDVFLPAYATCIEYDGSHHFIPRRYGRTTLKQAKEVLKDQQMRDGVKNKYCQDKGMKLLRIPYTVSNPDALVSNFIKTLEMSRFFYSQTDFSKDIVKMTNHIRSLGHEKVAIYGVLRGGLILATCLSYSLGCKEIGVLRYQRYDGNDTRVKMELKHSEPVTAIVVVDDLIDSGITIRKSISFLKRVFPKLPIYSAVLFGEENQFNTACMNQHPKKWIEFFWENS